MYVNQLHRTIGFAATLSVNGSAFLDNDRSDIAILTIDNNAHR